MTVVC